MLSECEGIQEAISCSSAIQQHAACHRIVACFSSLRVVVWGLGADLVFIKSVVNEESPSRNVWWRLAPNFLGGESASVPPAIPFRFNRLLMKVVVLLCTSRKSSLCFYKIRELKCTCV